ncbi:MAG: hypothetical protein AB1631_26745 [Acidobacteriota bacterium]
MYFRIAKLSARLCAVSLLLFCAFPAGAQNLPGWFEKFLQKHIHVTAEDIAGLERGEAIARVLKTAVKKEIAAVGIVRVDTSGDAFIEKFRDIVEFKKSSAVAQIGKFSNPPRLEDLKTLTLDPCCLNAIKNCETGDCDMQMSNEMMDRFRRELDPSAPDYATRANELARRILFDYVEAYLRTGNAALVEYHDQRNAVRLADEYRSLLAQSRFLAEYAPEFYKYLEEFPKASSPDVEDFIYWSKEKYGLKPVLSITHVAIYRRVFENRTEVLIASKQIYASHYFDGSLGLTAVVDGNQGQAASGSYLMYLNRSRVGALQGLFISLKRSVIGSRVRDGMTKNLRLIRRRLVSTVSVSAQP